MKLTPFIFIATALISCNKNQEQKIISNTDTLKKTETRIAENINTEVIQKLETVFTKKKEITSNNKQSTNETNSKVKKVAPVIKKSTPIKKTKEIVKIDSIIEEEIKTEIVETQPNIATEKKQVIAKVEPEIKTKASTIETKTNTAISNNTWGTLLKKHVDNKGNVSYKNFKADEKQLDSYLDFLAKNKPTTSSSKNEKLAYYINLYNASTVKLILQNYPVNSIKDIKSPWGKKWVKVGNELLSLGYIEHKILRKMDEPRIHFAINCASYSCPKLFNTIFTAANMEQKLEAASKDFVNDTSRNKYEEKAKLSKIFKWYDSDFKQYGGVLNFIAKYSTKNINTKSKIEYLDYDWSLNKKK